VSIIGGLVDTRRLERKKSWGKEGVLFSSAKALSAFQKREIEEYDTQKGKRFSEKGGDYLNKGGRLPIYKRIIPLLTLGEGRGSELEKKLE